MATYVSFIPPFSGLPDRIVRIDKDAERKMFSLNANRKNKMDIRGNQSTDGSGRRRRKGGGGKERGGRRKERGEEEEGGGRRREEGKEQEGGGRKRERKRRTFKKGKKKRRERKKQKNFFKKLYSANTYQYRPLLQFLEGSLYSPKQPALNPLNQCFFSSTNQNYQFCGGVEVPVNAESTDFGPQGDGPPLDQSLHTFHCSLMSFPSLEPPRQYLCHRHKSISVLPSCSFLTFQGLVDLPFTIPKLGPIS
ncbi:hypothetical protein E2320_012196, partial [Naja naja]